MTSMKFRNVLNCHLIFRALLFVCLVSVAFVYFSYMTQYFQPAVVFEKVEEITNEAPSSAAEPASTPKKVAPEPELPAWTKREISVDIVDLIGVTIFTWNHLLNATLDYSDQSKTSYYSTKKMNGVNFNYKLDCCHNYAPKNYQVEHKSGNVILGMWGRTTGAKENMQVVERLLADDSIQNVALIIFGDMDCNDSYLKEPLKNPKLRFVYITHESNMVDGKRVFLWPQGPQWAGVPVEKKVRPNLPYIGDEPMKVDLTVNKKYTSAFIGTVWDRRKPMVEVIKKNGDLFNNDRHLYSFEKSRYQEQTKSVTGDKYQYSLANSEFILSPRGMAAECYRTYEGLEYGAIPIIEDKVHSKCAREWDTQPELKSPYRLFKLYDAPYHFVTDWSKELPEIIREFEGLSNEEKVERRLKMHDWYINFKRKLGQKLVHDIKWFFV